MKFEIKEGSINGIISDKDGFPVLILDNAEGSVDVEHKNKNIKISFKIDNEDDINYILGIDIAK